MKIWTIEQFINATPHVDVCFSQADADARLDTHYRAVWAEYMQDEPFPGSADEAHSFLTGQDVPDSELMWVSVRDISEHPAVKEAEATLYSCLNRLELNDMDGEEQPFMDDCHTAIALLTA